MSADDDTSALRRDWLVHAVLTTWRASTPSMALATPLINAASSAVP